jgi:hypothetical protein
MDSTAVSKELIFVTSHARLDIRLVAGLYKPSSIRLEHGLILSAISGALPIARYQLHGKRQKRTVSLTNYLVNGSEIFLDKLVHEVLPRVADFRTPKLRRPTSNNFQLRLRQKISPLADFADLVEPSMFDDYRGVFLPLTVHFIFKNIQFVTSQTRVAYLRMLRLPFNFYKVRVAPAFDDLASFV